MLTQRESPFTPSGTDLPQDPGPDGLVRASLAAVLGEASLDAALAALATVLAQRLGCRRVAIGWVERDAWRVRALSHGAQVSERARLPELLEAMQESAVQGQSLCVPRVADGLVRITLAHRALMRQEGLLGVLTVPLALRGVTWGAVTCEREHGRFLPGEIIAMESMVEQVVPLLRLHHQAGLGAWARWRDSVRTGWAQQGRRGRMVWRWAAGATVLALAALLAWPLPRNLPAPARVEGALQRVMTAPMDGFLQQVMARPGDVVQPGQVLAQMADEDLQLQVRAFQADVAQHDNAFVDAFTRGERAEAAMAQARAMEARVQLARAQQQLIQSWDVLSTMTPHDYSAIRPHLGASSGFQSAQYRMMEFMLGGRDGKHVRLHKSNADWAQRLEAECARASLYDAAIRLLACRGFAIDASALERDPASPYAPDASVEAAWAAIYRDPQDHWDLYELAEKLVDLEYHFQRWRFGHLKTVERIIGFKTGTGGTPGVPYLAGVLKQAFFPELLSVRTAL